MLFKRVIALTVSAALVSQNLLFAAGEIKEHKRTNDMLDQITKSTKPSDLAIVGITDHFQKESPNLISDMDLSGKIGKKIFVGYGIYDIGEKNCKYVEQPGVSKTDYDEVIRHIGSFNGHTYGYAKGKYTFGQCKALAKRLGGNPVMIQSHSEASYIASTFTSKEIAGAKVGDAWVGVYRQSCSDNDFYKNTDEKKQDFFNWSTKGKPACQDGQRHVLIDRYGLFNAASESKSASCIIEFDSKDMHKPVKICASWWKVLRDYDGVKQTLYDINMLQRINQADIPISLALCTKYDEAQARLHKKNASSRTAHCTEYYSRTIAEGCYENPVQDICFVSECNGYIQNVCRPVKSDSVGKEYVKGEIMLNGKISEQETKTKIVTKEFDCPPSPISNKFCEERAQVMIYPQECPGSQCAELKECVYNSGSDTDKWNECFVKYKCIKIYGGRDNPKISASGEVLALRGKCPNGEVLDFPVNVQEKIDRKCLKYEVITKKERNVEKCSEEKGYQDHVVNMAITDKDIYQDNPKCIRLDEVTESQTKKGVIVKVTPQGFFSTRITQEYLDGQSEVLGDKIGSHKYTIQAANAKDPQRIDEKPKEVKEEGPQANNFSTAMCGPVQGLVNKMAALLPPGPDNADNDKTEGPSLPGGARVENNTIVFELYDYVPKGRTEKEEKEIHKRYGRNQCEGSGVDVLSRAGLGTVDSVLSCVNGRFKFGVYLPYFVQNASIRNGGSLAFTNTLGAGSEKSCATFGICMNGGYSFSGGRCYNWSDDGNAADAAEDKFYPDDRGKVKGNMTQFGERDVNPPVEAPIATPTTMQNGLQSILFLEEYVSGQWGWFSNYNSYPAKINRTEVSLSGGSARMVSGNDKKMTKITDLLNYTVDIHHWWKRKKKPSSTLMLASGAIASAFALARSYIAFGIENIGAYILLVLFTRPRNWDRQEIWYRLWKGIPHNFYDPGIYETRYDREDDNPGEPTFKDKWYGHLHMDMPDKRPNDAKDYVKKAHFAARNNMFEAIGIPRSEAAVHPWEEGNWPSNYPKCKKWNPWCEKVNDDWSGLYTPNSMIPYELNTFLEGDTNERGGKVNVRVELEDVKGRGTAINKVRKEMSVLYLGAVNTVIILVPYKGDYKLIARDALKVPLATFTVTKDLFKTKVGTYYPSAQVVFGDTMEVKVKNGCKRDRAALWGGGVVGNFWETQRTAENVDCSHANERHVLKHSAMYIEIIPQNMDRGFEHRLKLPLPFANRVWVVSLDLDEERHYRCFNDFEGCKDEDYKGVKDAR